MGPVLVLLFLVVPFVELAVIVTVGREVGVANTIGILILVSIVGAWLVKREGLGVWRRAQAQLDAGRVPGQELLDGLMILMAGALLITPGFLTDIVGIVLLLPPVRAGFRRLLTRRFEQRVSVYRVYRPGGGMGGSANGTGRTDEVIDVEVVDDDG